MPMVVVVIVLTPDLHPGEHAIVEVRQHRADDKEPAGLEKRDGLHPILRI
jgi:hypothetical protein